MRNYRPAPVQELPSKVLRDASWDSRGRLASCDDICVLDVVRCSFGIRDGDTVQDALDGNIDYLPEETVKGLRQYLDALAADIKQGCDEEYDVIGAIRFANDFWSKADEAHLNDPSLFNAHDLFETVEKALGYD